MSITKTGSLLDKKASIEPKTALKRSRIASDHTESRRFKRRAVKGVAPQNQNTSEHIRAPPKAPSASDKSSPKETPLQIFVCGAGGGGELGLGLGKKTAEAKIPRLNPYLSGILNCAAGGMHAAALTFDNRLLTWGVNDKGALGRDTQWAASELVNATADDENDSTTSGDDDDDDDDDDDHFDDEAGLELNPREAIPTAIDAHSFPAGTKFMQVTAGDSTSFALTTEGHVYGWGMFRDHNGDYGFTLDTAQPEVKIVKEQLRPARIFGLEGITQISAGADFALARDNKGQAFAWGCGQQCELGSRITLERHRVAALLPTRLKFPRNTKIQSVHAASNHAFAIDQSGNAWSWGLNNFGQTGIPLRVGKNQAVVSRPTRIKSLIGRRMKLISGGLHHSIGLTADGECLVWGRLDGDQMGLDIQTLLKDKPTSILRDEYGKPRCLLEPTPLPLPKCRYVAAGSDHCLAVTLSGKAYSWGFNTMHQCGQPTDDDDIKIATLMNGKAIREANIVWAGAGGQYSLLAAAV